MSNGPPLGPKRPILPFGLQPSDSAIGYPLVICGYGQIGRAVTKAMVRERPFATYVIDHSGANAGAARARRLHAVSGDATSVTVQRVARVGSAADIVICIDGPQNKEILRVARSLAPTAYIQMVLNHCNDPENLHELGADRVLVISNIAGMALAQWAVSL